MDSPYSPGQVLWPYGWSWGAVASVLQHGFAGSQQGSNHGKQGQAITIFMVFDYVC